MTRRECIGLHWVRWLMRFDSFDIIQCGSPFTLGIHTNHSHFTFLVNRNECFAWSRPGLSVHSFYGFWMKIKSLIWWKFLSLLLHSLIFEKIFFPCTRLQPVILSIRLCVSSLFLCNPYPVCLHCILRKDSYPSNPCHTFASPFHISSLLSILCSFEKFISIEMVRLCLFPHLKTHTHMRNSFAYVLHSQMPFASFLILEVAKVCILSSRFLKLFQ